MPKKSSTTTATPAPSVPVAPATEKKQRKPKAAPVVETAPVVAPVAEPENVVVSEEVPVESEDVQARLSSEFSTKLQLIANMVASLRSEYRALEKNWNRAMKTAQKSSSKKKRKAGNRSPSGFVKPTKISDELAVFLGKEKGSEMARTEVTREINQYIRSHNLQDKENGRRINPDAKLSALLKLANGSELTYFNLQKHMSPHFAKTAST